MAGTVLVDTVPYDFQSLETEFVGSGQSFGIVQGLDQFDYTVTINRTEIYGRSRLPLVVTEGEAQFDASITVHRWWWDQIQTNSRVLGVPLAELNILLAFTFFAPGQTLHTDTLTGVRLKEIKNSGQRGPDPQMVSMPLRLGNIFFDGVDVFGNKL